MEPGQFLQSLQEQSYRDFELIVVDQNSDDRLKTVLESYADKYPILHMKSVPGLSRARNVGLDRAGGDVVVFPDDDCRYPHDLLQRIKDWLEQNPDYDGVSGRSVAPDGQSTVGSFDSHAGEITKHTIWRRTTSIGLFLRLTPRTKDLRFDPRLGLGAETGWGSAEDIDFPLRAMARGARLYYDPDLYAIHPPARKTYHEKDLQQAATYSAGFGYVLKKHGYSFWFVLIKLIRPLGASMLFVLFNRARARFHWNVFRGRIRGLRG